LLRYNLSRAGFGVCTFSGASKALEEFHRVKPDLIPTDWLMPGMDGLEFCRILRQTPEMSKVPIIMISCKGDETDVPAACQCGVADYFVKPFPIRDLVDRIRCVLESCAA
jgi:DNA-binding response OmpR family regulator